VVADCRLNGSRSLPNQTEPQVTTHFTARVRLTRQVPETVSAPALGEPDGAMVEAADIYRVFFHGPAYQVLERAWLNDHQDRGPVLQRAAQQSLSAENPLAMAPRLIELCFQTAALREVPGKAASDCRCMSAKCLWRAPHLADGPLYAVVTPDADEDSFERKWWTRPETATCSFADTRWWRTPTRWMNR
jgi:hypothetical protein